MRRRRATQAEWSSGNRFQLLENGEQFFPAVFADIDRARSEVLIETFIWFEDVIGLDLQRRLIAAARRGVRVSMTIDGYGSPDLSTEFKQALVEAGVNLHIYDPRPRFLGLRTNIFRRLHRKLAVIDNEVAFVGGINYSIDQVSNSSPLGKQDYSMRLTGPLVAEIRQFCRQQADQYLPKAQREKPGAAPAAIADSTLDALTSAPDALPGEAIFVTRDNQRHRTDIERHYYAAMRQAQREILICNAYFFPGYRFLRALRQAARRGVNVTLILQGQPDMPAVRTWATMLYPPLLRAGVHIHEYRCRPLHAKVAVIDEQWATVGSSNLDPLSLALNLEANVLMRSPQFARLLASRLKQMVAQDCAPIEPVENGGWFRAEVLWQSLAYHCTRYIGTWAEWLPSRAPRLQSMNSARAAQAADTLISSQGR